MESFRKVMVYKRNLFDKIKVVLFEYFFEKFLKRQIRVDFIPHKYLYFKTTEEINYWGECFNRFFRLKKDRIASLKATKEELYEIETYEYYVGNVSKNINDFLRGKEVLFPYLLEPRIVSES